MRKTRGFKIGKKLIRISRWIIRKTRIRPDEYRLLDPPPERACKPKPLSKLISWSRRLTQGAKSLCSSKPGFGYIPVGRNPIVKQSIDVPKGHLAIYVGKKDGEFHRVTVPVIYFNHPLFGELLREAEEEYGFGHEGGITIPCPFSDFERVKTRIASGSGFGKLTRRRRC